RVVEMQSAVLADDALPTIGDQKIVKQQVGIVAGGVQLEANAIDLALTLRAQLLLYLLEEVVIRVPGLRQVLHIVAGLLDQRPPDMVGPRRQRIWGAVEAALLRHAVVAVRRSQRGLAVL